MIHSLVAGALLAVSTLVPTPAQTQAVADDTPVGRNGQLHVCGTKLCNERNEPVQLRGMSTHGLQWYANCVKTASLDALANDWKADILRISMYVQEDGYETDPEKFTNLVNTYIEEATKRGLYALVDWHQLDPGDPNENLGLAKTFFTEIAERHKDKKNIIYDIANEPNGVSWAGIKSYAEQMVPVIRAKDPDGVIFVGTHGWASLGVSDGGSEADVIDDPVNATNLMYTFHFYAASHQQEYFDALSRAADRIPLFVTEFGTQTYTGDGGNDFTWSQKYLDFLESKQIGWTNWNFSDDFRSGAVFKEGTCSGEDFTGTTMLKPAGVWIRDHIRNRTASTVTTDVSTSAELKAALTAAKPGDTIKLADGTYTGNFKTTVDGTSSAPITLTGSSNAVLQAGGGYGLHLDGASYWNVKGITVTGGQKGIMIDGATHVTIDGVTVHGLDMEGVHFRNSSTYGVIKNSRIYDTGNDGRGMGEGVYVGSAGGTSDKSDRVQILGNTIGPDVGGEAVDVKEGTTGGLVSGNSFDGRGLTGANYDDSWIDVKGNNYVIENNTGKNTTNNGYETHTQQSGWGCGTVFRGNTSDLTGATGSGRYAFNITNYSASSCKVTIDRSNTMTGGKALANPGIPVT
ncbi:aryl-phospho-beta-D-glucosidase BglC (GH1 family) [Kribbella pratensis]|uniref:cellulase n=1 Tax=Kribbella pratensis TaxID=2512112 RepID=A0ABY2FQA2_9ACTN|nr:cellulase family glycosylhydrolase [Kribbella pratensis]TDW95327.1 aryl-phospho-beta-D-glucosidase BglC (GH1 family) [Kribbella pratensis]